jgi:RNA polymerase sigma-70 factor (family 1)
MTITGGRSILFCLTLCGTRLTAMPINDEKKLIQLLAESDQEAFTEIFDYYRDKIFCRTLRFLKSQVLAEEIVQDVFLKIWLKRSELQHVQSLHAYISSMANNLIIDRLKNLSYETTARNELSKRQRYIEDTDYLLRQHEYQQLIQDAINLLPARQKQVYELAKTAGMNQQSIAEMMHLSRLTVKKHMAKALQFIRRYINSHLL